MDFRSHFPPSRNRLICWIAPLSISVNSICTSNYNHEYINFKTVVTSPRWRPRQNDCGLTMTGCHNKNRVMFRGIRQTTEIRMAKQKLT